MMPWGWRDFLDFFEVEWGTLPNYHGHWDCGPSLTSKEVVLGMWTCFSWSYKHLLSSQYSPRREKGRAMGGWGGYVQAESGQKGGELEWSNYSGTWYKNPKDNLQYKAALFSSQPLTYRQAPCGLVLVATDKQIESPQVDSSSGASFLINAKIS